MRSEGEENAGIERSLPPVWEELELFDEGSTFLDADFGVSAHPSSDLRI